MLAFRAGLKRSTILNSTAQVAEVVAIGGASHFLIRRVIKDAKSLVCDCSVLHRHTSFLPLA